MWASRDEAVRGTLELGKQADLVVLDDNYDVLQTYCMGKAQL